MTTQKLTLLLASCLLGSTAIAQDAAPQERVKQEPVKREAPTRGVSPDAFFDLRFNEPIGDNGENQLESVLISRTPIAPEGPFDGRDVALSVGMPIGMSPLTGG